MSANVMLIGYASENLVRAQRFYVVRGEAPDNFRGVASGVRYLEVKMYVKVASIPGLLPPYGNLYA